MEVIKTVKLDGETLRIVYDPDATSPREWDNLGTLYAWGEYKHLGDEHDHDFEYPGDLIASGIHKGGILIPVYIFVHGNITLSTTPFGCTFDSGKLGYYFMSKEKIIHEYGVEHDREKVRSYMENEIKTYDSFLQGNTYGYTIHKDAVCGSCAHNEPEEMDSCYGFIGDDWANEIVGELPDKWQKELAK